MPAVLAVEEGGQRHLEYRLLERVAVALEDIPVAVVVEAFARSRHCLVAMVGLDGLEWGEELRLPLEETVQGEKYSSLEMEEETDQKPTRASCRNLDRMVKMI